MTDVLVVGAGPVGLTLALDLAWRGVDVPVLETRHRGERPSVKSNHVAARTMEMFRRLGVAANVRKAGLPADYPNDVAYRTAFLGTELTRVPIPCRADRYSATSGPDAWWPTPEPPQVPYAGYGMNAGIADATNLSWLLAAHLDGWADEAILDSYQAERLPITEQVSHFAMNHALAMNKARKEVPREIEADGPEGQRVRAAIGKAAYDLNVQQYCCAGLNFGYYYQGSPIIAYDSDTPPPYSMGEFTPSTAPGARVPHLWLAPGRSLYDALGPYYTLLRFDAAVDVSALTAAAEDARMPLTVLDVPRQVASDVYRHALLLARPDQHVAWRGNAAPADPRALVDVLRGARRGTACVAA